jgi:hypothetical protein
MDPHVEVCQRFEEARVRYVIVGVFGINFYARQAGQLMTTADCDIFVSAQLRTFRKSLQILVSLGFLLEAGGEPVPNLDPVLLKGILRARAVVYAARSDARIDLCTQITGARFEELWKVHREFVVEGVPIRVAPLEALVESKRLAGRPKDNLFLEQHKEIIESMLRKQGRH